MDTEKNTLDILRTKIGLLSKENQSYNERMKVANSATQEAGEREKEAEKKIKELTKQLTIRKIELSRKIDDHSNQIVQIKKKEEATAEAKKEINVLLQKAILLKSEIDRVNNVLPKTAQNLCIASEKADNQLKSVKKLEVRAMLADQTIEEMEQQLSIAETMTEKTNSEVTEMQKKLEARNFELLEAQKNAEKTEKKVQLTKQVLNTADVKMANIQDSLEEKSNKDSKYRQRLTLLKDQILENNKREKREMKYLINLKKRISHQKTKRNII